ncbi:MAG: histidine phosphatase family protein [bacterium]|nr:histidine phosphatase family protein [bacterium]
MKVIYFIRHGESEANVGGVRQGGATPLTLNGKKQAEFVAERVSKLPIDLIISSTMMRAKDTAQAIHMKTGKPIEYNDLFVERKQPSSFMGKAGIDSEIKETLQEINNNFTVPEYRHSDEETFVEIKERASKALAHLKERPEEKIVVVTHGHFLKTILASVIFGPELSAHECQRVMDGLRTRNTGVSVIIDEEKSISGWNVLIFNDHAHLADV